MIDLIAPLTLFATTPKGLELLLVDELRSLGAMDPAEKLAGVSFTGDLTLAYKACLWSRLANRILLRLKQFPAVSPEELYDGIQTIQWDENLAPENSLSVNFICSQSKITHSLYGAQKVKDAIVDQMRNKFNVRPNVAKENPDLNIHVYLHRDIATISLDLSGESLHKRGYRLAQVAAPLKENLAAAILLRAGWKAVAEKKGMLLDPMCGSGTLLIEAALMAGNIAPGLLREYYGFKGWKKHNTELWEQLIKEAKQNIHVENIPPIVGYDIDSFAIKSSFANIERAGLREKIHVEKRELSALTKPKREMGLLVVNPPYGERLGELPDLQKLYMQLGHQLKKDFIGWNAAVFTGNPELGKNMGLRSCKQYALFNGAIPCQLLLFDVQPEYFIDRSPEANNERRVRKAKKILTDKDQQNAQMFANRLRKNVKNLKRWVERNQITNYRVYDADLPEYAVSIDIFGQYVCVEEYPAPKTIDKQLAEKRLQHILAVLPEALEVSPTTIFLRDYAHQSDLKDFYQISDSSMQFVINLTDADLEVGFSLEQRDLLHLIQKSAYQKRFLNLYAGSGITTIYASLGGATTKSIVEHEFHRAWIQKNMALNDVSGLVEVDDVEEWLIHEKSQYDMIYAELPQHAFFLREEHPDLLRKMVKLLSPQGELILLTKDTRFKLAPELFGEFAITELTTQILPVDFKRTPKVQQSWKIKFNNA